MAEKIKANTLEELIEYLSKRFDVSYAKLARIVVKTAKWQKEKMIRDCSVQSSYEAEIEKAEKRGYNLCKDALLEWLKEKVKWYGGTDIAPHYQKVIDKINSM